jgi:urease accessory protein
MEGAYGGDPVLGPALLSLRPRFQELEVPAHFLMALSAGLRAAGFPLEEAQSLLLHMALRDQLGAAVRLGLVGSLQAQGMHRRFAARAEALRKRHASRPHHLARKTAPMIEMGQAGHPYLYSRLFQS